jgi:hypothetical protein
MPGTLGKLEVLDIIGSLVLGMMGCLVSMMAVLGINVPGIVG